MMRSKARLELLYGVLAQYKRWLVLINADPDAVGSSMAFRRLASRRTAKMDIARINEIQRPDNLSLLRYVRAPIVRYNPEMLNDYDAFAVIDSQPHHSSLFNGIPFSVVIDHHPAKEMPVEAPFVDIRPDYGATATMLAEYLSAARIMPGRLLATALLYDIRTDTANFTRPFTDMDMRAYRNLARKADHGLISSIVHSEFRLPWLRLFSRALRSMRRVGSGYGIFMGPVDNPDILVVVADFLMRVHEIRWAAVYGQYENKIIVVLRSDGTRNVGDLAQRAFGDLGTAGGHKTMGRAEIPVEAFGNAAYSECVFKRLHRPKAHKNCGDAPVAAADGEKSPVSASVSSPASPAAFPLKDAPRKIPVSAAGGKNAASPAPEIMAAARPKAAPGNVS